MEYYHALDLSLSNCGYAIFGAIGNLLRVGSIHTDPKKSHGQRLEIIHDALTLLRNKYPTKSLILESGFCRFNKATLALGEVKGVTILVYADCEITEYAPKSIKKIVTGSGKSSKEEVAAKVGRRYPGIEFENWDMSDAVSVGVAYFLKHNILE